MRLVHNSLFIIAANVLQMVTSWLFLVGLARYLALAEFGSYSFMNALVSGIMAISLFGIGKVLIREISRNRADAASLTGVALAVRVALIVLSGGVAIIIGFLVLESSKQLIGALVLAVLANAFLSYTQLLVCLFQAFEKMQYEPLLVTVSSLIALLGLASVIHFDLGFMAVFLVLAAAGMIRGLLATVVMLRKFLVPSFELGRDDLRWIIRESTLVGIGIFLYFNLFRVNVLWLQWLRGAQEVAYFQSVHTIIMQMEILPVAFMGAIFPRLSRLFLHDPNNAEFVCAQVFKHLFVAGLFLAVFLFAYADQIVYLVLGDKFLQSVGSLQLLAWSVVALFMDIGVNNVLVALGKQRATVVFGAIALLLNSILGAVLIYSFGYVGAATATLLAYWILFLISFGYTSRLVGGKPLIVGLLRPVLASIAGLMVILLLKRLDLTLALTLGTAVYLSLNLIFKAVNPKEMRRLLLN